MKIRRKTTFERELEKQLATVTKERDLARQNGGTAMRDALQSAALIAAFASCADAAEAFLQAGDRDMAREALSIVRSANIHFLRARVMREPGGSLRQSKGSEKGK